jgi:hypothetical protein
LYTLLLVLAPNTIVPVPVTVPAGFAVESPK